MVMFVILILLWLFREPRFIPGWGSFFREEGDTVYAMLHPWESCVCVWGGGGGGGGDSCVIIRSFLGRLSIVCVIGSHDSQECVCVCTYNVCVCVCVCMCVYMCRYVSDATAVLTIVFLLFLIPSEPCFCSWKST